jgi:hypothetical protein
MIPLSRAAAALARYAQMLKGMHSRGLLLAPLRNQEAVISSRMEGTVSTLDEVLRYEPNHDDAEEAYSGKYRTEAIEVPLYGPALKMAQASVTEGLPLSSWTPRSAHQVLPGFARGAHMAQ